MKTVKTLDGIPANFFVAGLRADNALDGAYQVMVFVEKTMFLHNYRFSHYEAVVDGYGHTLPVDVKDRAEARAVALINKICTHLKNGGKLDSSCWDATDFSVIYGAAYGTDNTIEIQFN